MPAKAAKLIRTRAQRIPFRPGDRYSNKGRIHSRRPILSPSSFRLQYGGGPYIPDCRSYVQKADFATTEDSEDDRHATVTCRDPLLSCRLLGAGRALVLGSIKLRKAGGIS